MTFVCHILNSCPNLVYTHNVIMKALMLTRVPLLLNGNVFASISAHGPYIVAAWRATRIRFWDSRLTLASVPDEHGHSVHNVCASAGTWTTVSCHSIRTRLIGMA